MHDRDSRRLSTFTAADARACVFAPRSDDDKYHRGVVGVVTGSAAFPGAARLGVEAAMRTGCGMVRYVGPDAVGAAILQARPEAVMGEGRVDAVVAGSGIGDLRDDERAATVEGHLAAGTPTVLDAGALELVRAERQAGTPFASAILTPHAREFARLTLRLDADDASGRDDERARSVLDDPIEWALKTMPRVNATLLLKGAQTIVVSPDGSERYIIDAPTSVLATAGTGDVLAGIVGALAATAMKRAIGERPTLERVAAAAAWVHGRAALLASARAADPVASAQSVVAETPGRISIAPVTALDVATAVPGVIGALLEEPGA